MQHRFIFPLVLLWCISCAGIARSETVTFGGIPLFDTSLGTLQRVIVTIDPSARQTDPTFVNASSHSHEIGEFSVSLFTQTFDFGPVNTNSTSGVGDPSHTHTFDMPPVSGVFEGDSLAFFLPGPPIIRPNGQFVSGPAVSDVGHTHSISTFFVSFDTEATTTFEYVPVPEPGAYALVVMCVLVMASKRSKRSL